MVTGTGLFRNHFVLSPTLCGQVYVVERHPVFVVRSVGWHLAERHHGDDDAAGGDGCGSYLDHYVEPCRAAQPVSSGVVVMSLRGCSLLQEAADDMGPWGYILGAVQPAGTDPEPRTHQAAPTGTFAVHYVPGMIAPRSSASSLAY